MSIFSVCTPAGEAFGKVKKSHNVLSDKGKRAEYDLEVKSKQKSKGKGKGRGRGRGAAQKEAAPSGSQVDSKEPTAAGKKKSSSSAAAKKADERTAPDGKMPGEKSAKADGINIDEGIDVTISQFQGSAQPKGGVDAWMGKLHENTMVVPTFPDRLDLNMLSCRCLFLGSPGAPGLPSCK